MHFAPCVSDSAAKPDDPRCKVCLMVGGQHLTWCVNKRVIVAEDGDIEAAKKIEEEERIRAAQTRLSDVEALMAMRGGRPN